MVFQSVVLTLRALPYQSSLNLLLCLHLNISSLRLVINQSIGLLGKVFANGPRDQG